MSKTNSLRMLIQSKLKTVCSDVYFENADEKALYPHVVYSWGTTLNDDLHRDDVSVIIDVWDRSTKASVIENLCDDIEVLFDNSNLPQNDILPTFFLDSRLPVPDEDKRIKHRQLKIIVQNYER